MAKTTEEIEKMIMNGEFNSKLIHSKNLTIVESLEFKNKQAYRNRKMFKDAWLKETGFTQSKIHELYEKAWSIGRNYGWISVFKKMEELVIFEKNKLK